MSDLSINPADVLPVTSKPLTATCGAEPIVQGNQVYIDTSGLAQLGYAADATTAKSVGVAVNSSYPGQPCQYLIAGANVALGNVLQQGMIYVTFIHTSGGICPFVDLDMSSNVYYVNIVGIAQSNEIMTLIFQSANPISEFE